MKKAAALLLVFVFLLSGCLGSKQNLSTMEKIQKQLNEMESYQCSATLKRISNKGETTYETKQYYKSTGEYRLELNAPESVAGNFTVYDGVTVCQYNPRVSGKVMKDVPVSQMRNELFLGQFVKNYMQSEEVSIAVSKMNLGKCTVLEAVIPGNNKYTATEKLWIDEDTLKPVQFVIYDTEGKERYVVNYHEFEYNVALEPSLFEVPAN